MIDSTTAAAVATLFGGFLAFGAYMRRQNSTANLPALTDEAPPGNHFTWEELTRSATAERDGIDNTPNASERAALRELTVNILDPLRRTVGRAVHVTSGFRSDALNRAVGGASGSQHRRGEAVDVKVTGYDAERLARLVVQRGLPFDQLIWYAEAKGGHLHLSYTKRRSNRGQMLHQPANGGLVAWQP